MPERQLPTTSLSISFSSDVLGAGEDAFALQAEVNADDNAGETRFLFGGAAPVFRVYKSSNIKTLRFFQSDGSISGSGSGTETVTEVVVFSNSRTARTKYPIKLFASAVALGNSDLGAISKAGPAELQCSKVSTGPTDPIIGVYRVTYTADYTKHNLGGVGEPADFGAEDFTEYPVHIHILGMI